MIEKIAIFGTSGFAYEVADVCYSLGATNVVLLSDMDSDIALDSRIEVVSESNVDALQKQGYEFAIGVGDPKVRQKIFTKFSNLTFPNLTHPRATFGYKQNKALESVVGNIITAGVVFTNNIVFGNFGVFNLNCTIGHDCTISDYVSIMPSANISGNVALKSFSYIGVGAIVLQGTPEAKMVVNVGAIVGAGALVTKPVAENTTVCGVPAKALK